MRRGEGSSGRLSSVLAHYVSALVALEGGEEERGERTARRRPCCREEQDQSMAICMLL